MASFLSELVLMKQKPVPLSTFSKSRCHVNDRCLNFDSIQFSDAKLNYIKSQKISFKSVQPF